MLGYFNYVSFSKNSVEGRLAMTPPRTLVALRVVALLALLLHAPLPDPGFAADLLDRPAPDLVVEEVLTGPEPEALSWESLRGQAVVMELWATWCGPCVASQQHWNRLVDEFADEPVRFVSLSDEETEVVTSFLEKRPLKGWIALDQDRSFFEAMQIQSIPQTVLVDAEGRLQAVAPPTAITADTIRNLIDGRPLQLGPPAEEHTQVALGPDGQPAPLLHISVRPSTASSSQIRMLDGTFQAIGFKVGDMLTYAYQVPEPRLVVETALPGERFDFELTARNKNGRDFPRLAQLALEQSFGLGADRRSREMEVLILGRRTGVEPKLEPARTDAQGMISKPGFLAANAVTLDELAGFLERALRRPVVVEVEGLDEAYQLELTWDPKTEGSLHQAVREELGLELLPDRRQVEVWVVGSQQQLDQPPSSLSATRTEGERSWRVKTAASRSSGDSSPGS